MKTTTTTIKVNKVFNRANTTRCRYKVLLGSASSGKSYNTAIDYIAKLSSHQFIGANLLVIRKHERDHRESTYSQLVSAIEVMKLSHVWTCNLSPLRLTNNETGSEIIFKGLHDQKSIESLKSITFKRGYLCWIWLEEATAFTMNDFNIIDTRVRAELPSHLYPQITLTFNPINARHWIKLNLWDSTDNKNIFKLKTTYLDNAFLHKDYIVSAERMKEQDYETYRVMYLGEWGESEALIYSRFKKDNYSNIMFDDYTIGVDFGYTHPTAVLYVGWKDEEPYVLQELYQSHLTSEQLVDLMEQMKFPKNVRMFCDSADPSKISTLKRAGYKTYPVLKNATSVQSGISFLQSKTIHVNLGCDNTYGELLQYRYKKDNATGLYTDTPIKLNDDALDSLRYASEPYIYYKKETTMHRVNGERFWETKQYG